MGRVDGKVAFITGAGRGQGRSHAIRLAEEGAKIIATDICRPIEGLTYPLSSRADLDETVRLVESIGGEILAHEADVRDREQLDAAAKLGAEKFGKIDVVVANAGITFNTEWDSVTPEMWHSVLDVNLTGVWNTIMATSPHLIAAGGGAIVCTSSSAGVRGIPFMVPYVASKHGVEGLVKAFAFELSEHRIRVNGVIPTGVDTPMGATEAGRVSGGDVFAEMIAKHPRFGGSFSNIFPIEITQPVDISNAILYLVSDEARYVTATSLAVDAGYTQY